MITHLPEIYPDETMFSWLSRIFIHGGYLNHADAMKDLYAKRSDNPNKEFFGNLNSGARKVLFSKYDPIELALHHTMFPQYARFLTAEHKQFSLEIITNDVCDARHLLRYEARKSIDAYLKFCPICVQKDRDIYGEAYWHCSHQIRNMQVCTKHNCLLASSDVPAKAEGGFRFFPAELCTIELDPVTVMDPLLLEFENYLERMFHAPLDLNYTIPVASILHEALQNYLKPSGRSRYMARLSEDIRCFYERLGIGNVASLSQIQRVLLTNTNRQFSVVCQIGFFLGVSCEKWSDRSVDNALIAREKSTHYMKNKPAVDWQSLDSMMAKKLCDFALPIYNGSAYPDGRPGHVSERLVIRLLDLRGHQLEQLPKTRAVFEKYAESYEETWARRLVWAYKRLRSEKDVVYWSDLREISGVKKANFKKVIPYLRKHTSAKTATAIIAIVQRCADQ